LAKGFIATTLLMSVLAAPSAFGGVPTTFSNGEVADADAVNGNFQSLDGRISSLESVPIDASASAAAGSFGLPQLDVDCTTNPSALQDAWGRILISSPIAVILTGGCKEPQGGITLGGQTIALSGGGDNLGECTAATLLPADPANPNLTLYLNFNSSLWLNCLQLGTGGNVQIAGFASDYLRMQGVKKGGGELTVELRNGGVFRSYDNNQTTFLTLKNNSTAEINHFYEDFGSFPIALSSSRIKFRFALPGTMSQLSLSKGSVAEFYLFNGPIEIVDLTLTGRSFIYLTPSGTTPEHESLVTGSQTLTDGSAIFSD
jgi:hypothetical protein